LNEGSATFALVKRTEHRVPNLFGQVMNEIGFVEN